MSAQHTINGAPVAPQKTVVVMSFDEWFDLWDETRDPEERRLCKIAWNAGRCSSDTPVINMRAALAEAVAMIDEERAGIKSGWSHDDSVKLDRLRELTRG